MFGSVQIFKIWNTQIKFENLKKIDYQKASKISEEPKDTQNIFKYLKIYLKFDLKIENTRNFTQMSKLYFFKKSKFLSQIQTIPENWIHNLKKIL